MLTEEMQKQIVNKELEGKREQIVHNILSKYAKKKGLVKYEYSDGFYVFGNPDSQELADKKHEEWLERQRKAKPYIDKPLKYNE
jgi:prophage tail gpP-like protein